MLTREAIRFFADRPALFAEKVVGVKPDKRQAEVLDSLAHNKMTSVRSGHGVGKSAVEAWAVIWFMVTRPFPKIPCTAPTQHQLFDILWAEVSKWIRHRPELAKELIWTKEKLYMNGYPEEWFAVARTASKPDALQGFHAEHLLYIIDEASGVDDKIFEPVLGALSTPGARLLMCGNPTQLSGFFYDSHHKNRGAYRTFHIDGRESGRVPQDFVDTIIRMYGKDSDVFRVRVAGEFPLAESDVFIPLPLVERSTVTEWRPGGRPAQIHIGVDVARYGEDKTVITYRTDEKLNIWKKRNGQDTMKTADDVLALGMELAARYKLDREKDDPIFIKIDDSGVGGGVVDRLFQIKRNAPDRLWWMEICPVIFGKKIRHKYYDDTTTYMMAVVRSLLRPYDEDGNEKPVELILPQDDDLAGQLSTRKYGMTEGGKLRVESKKVMKARGLPSPDVADSVLLACLPIRPPKGARNGKEQKGGERPHH
jgi:hypothetical protein